jgi:hypothetical protein
MKNLYFEKCYCNGRDGVPHGYLYVRGRRYPVTVYSVESGEIGVESIASQFGFSRADTAEARIQLRMAGLAKEMTVADLEALTAGVTLMATKLLSRLATIG